MTRCLSIHVHYRCRHAGACCSAEWTVPAEPHVLQIVSREQIRPIADHEPFVEAPAGATVSGLVVAQARGACVFFDAAHGRLCAIHRAAGAEALPTSCRHFPRLYRRDAAGTHLSLSHFCPTAAAMLLDDVALTITTAAPPLALAGVVEGLDATGALPPLLRPDVLMDLEGYGEWEERAIATFARDDVTYREALGVVSAATETLRRWRPGEDTLPDAVRTAFAQADGLHSDDADQGDTPRLDLVDVACPAPARPVVARARRDAAVTARIASVLRIHDAAVKRYLAARLFANWIAYQGRDLRSVVEWLRACLAVLRSEIALGADFIDAVRETDRIMLHVVDSQTWAHSNAFSAT